MGKYPLKYKRLRIVWAKGWGTFQHEILVITKDKVSFKRIAKDIYDVNEEFKWEYSTNDLNWKQKFIALCNCFLSYNKKVDFNKVCDGDYLCFTLTTNDNHRYIKKFYCIGYHTEYYELHELLKEFIPLNFKTPSFIDYEDYSEIEEEE